MANLSIELTDEDVQLLNSKVGLKYLCADNKTNLEKALKLAKYENRLIELQTELIKVQNW